MGLFHFTFGHTHEYFTIPMANYFTFSGEKIFHKKPLPVAACNVDKGSDKMAESKLRDLSTDFAVKIIKLCEDIKGHYFLVNQLERSATSIGANVREANYAHSKADFIAKLQIALKECYETEYWLELFVKSEIAEKEAIKDLYHQCGTVRRILVASINTAKQNCRN